jgi:hypothetical protein
MNYVEHTALTCHEITMKGVKMKVNKNKAKRVGVVIEHIKNL